MNIQADVLVVGGGAAGIAAAVSASRNGAKVILVERLPYLGGKATSSVVGTVCGLFYRSLNPSPNYLDEGFPKEFAERLAIISHTKPIFNNQGLHFLPYDPFAFKLLCDNLIKENKIDLYLHSTCYSTLVDNGKINSINAFVNDQNVKFEAEYIIDCSGEATVSKLANCEMILTHEFQTSAQVFTMGNVSEIEEGKLSMGLLRALARGVDTGILEEELNRVTIVPGSLRNSNVLLKLSIPKSITHGVNEITSLQMWARKSVIELVSFFQKYIPSFKNAHLSWVADEVGIRTGKRPAGKHVLTAEEVLGCKKSKDSVARGGWPIEEWNLDKMPSMQYFDLEDYYDIPTATLISKDISNLFFAGRNISATDAAIGSARVIGTCLMTGWSAGRLAMRNGE